MNIHNYHEWKLGLIHADTHLWICWQMLFAQKLAHSTSRNFSALNPNYHYWIPRSVSHPHLHGFFPHSSFAPSPFLLFLSPMLLVPSFFFASLQCWLVFLSVFWWWFPSKPSQFLSSPWVWPKNSRCYHDFPGQGPTPWAAPWGCHGPGGREVMGPKSTAFFRMSNALWG